MFTKDSRTENFLTQMGVSFKYTNNMSIKDLVQDWDKFNLARPVPVREEAVIEYATLMENGSAAPAPILHSRPSGCHVLDGIQRLLASQMKQETKFSAYMVDCDSEDLLMVIRVLANARLQGREPAEWTRRRAVEVLVVGRGLTADEVARMGGWRPADILRLAGIIRWGLKIAAAGGPELSDSMLEVVGRHLSEGDLAISPEPISEFLDVVKAAKFSAADAEPYVQDFFAPVNKVSQRHRIYSERLNGFKTDPEVVTRVHGRKGAAMQRDIVLMRALKSADSVLGSIVADGDPLPYIDEFFRLLKSIDKKLKSIAPNQKAVTARVPADLWSKDAQTQKSSR